jgi:hypothetical protein
MKATVRLLLTALAIAACGSDEWARLSAQDQPTEAPERAWVQGEAGPLDACALLTATDVAEVVGSEPRKPKPAQSRQMPGSPMEGSTCEYRGDGWRIRFSSSGDTPSPAEKQPVRPSRTGRR